jgi:hypothetical protein
LIAKRERNLRNKAFQKHFEEIDYHLHRARRMGGVAINTKDYVMSQRLIIAAAWTCLAFIVFATLSPINARSVIAGGYFTIVERFGAYALLGLLFYSAYPRHLKLVCLLVFGSAVTLELLQAMAPDRDPRALDAIEKMLGGRLASHRPLLFNRGPGPNSSPQLVSCGATNPLFSQ